PVSRNPYDFASTLEGAECNRRTIALIGANQVLLMLKQSPSSRASSPMTTNSQAHPWGLVKAPEDSRPPSLATASLRWITAAGEPRQVDGKVGDFTSGGVVFYVPEPLE